MRAEIEAIITRFDQWENQVVKGLKEGNEFHVNFLESGYVELRSLPIYDLWIRRQNAKVRKLYKDLFDICNGIAVALYRGDKDQVESLKMRFQENCELIYDIFITMYDKWYKMEFGLSAVEHI